jgi:hypothetical protein
MSAYRVILRMVFWVILSVVLVAASFWVYAIVTDGKKQVAPGDPSGSDLVALALRTGAGRQSHRPVRPAAPAPGRVGRCRAGWCVRPWPWPTRGRRRPVGLDLGGRALVAFGGLPGCTPKRTTDECLPAPSATSTTSSSTTSTSRNQVGSGGNPRHLRPGEVESQPGRTRAARCQARRTITVTGELPRWGPLAAGDRPVKAR